MSLLTEKMRLTIADLIVKDEKISILTDEVETQKAELMAHKKVLKKKFYSSFFKNN